MELRATQNTQRPAEIHTAFNATDAKGRELGFTVRLYANTYELRTEEQYGYEVPDQTAERMLANGGLGYHLFFAATVDGTDFGPVRNCGLFATVDDAMAHAQIMANKLQKRLEKKHGVQIQPVTVA